MTSVHHFINGIDPAIGDRVRDKRPRKLADAVTKAFVVFNELDRTKKDAAATAANIVNSRLQSASSNLQKSNKSGSELQSFESSFKPNNFKSLPKEKNYQNKGGSLKIGVKSLFILIRNTARIRMDRLVSVLG
jgi:hypothetical protein